jgi:hypothetical protein
MILEHGGSKVRSRAGTLMLLGGFGGISFIATFVVLGFTTPGYDSLHETISALELTPIGLGQQINFFVFGVLICFFALGLRRELQQGFGAELIPLFQFFGGLGVIGDAIFIRSAPHLACDLVAFNSSLCVLFLFGWRFRGDRRWPGWSAYSIFTAIAMMTLLFGFGMALHFGGPAGLLEKLAAATRTVWSVLLVSRLLAGARLGPG